MTSGSACISIRPKEACARVCAVSRTSKASAEVSFSIAALFNFTSSNTTGPLMPRRLSACLWRELDEGENCWLSYGAGHLVYILKSIKRRGHHSGSRFPGLSLSFSPSCIPLRAPPVMCLMFWRLNGFKYEHESVKWHNSSLIHLTTWLKTGGKNPGSITYADITFHHDNHTPCVEVYVASLEVSPFCLMAFNIF